MMAEEEGEMMEEEDEVEEVDEDLLHPEDSTTVEHITVGNQDVKILKIAESNETGAVVRIISTDDLQLPLPSPFFKNDGLQSYIECLVLLKNINPDDERILKTPPMKPLAAGQVYIYGLTEGQSPYDWRFDGFQWANLRANNYPKKSPNPLLTRHEFRLLDNGIKVDFYRHEYHEPGHNFKTPICLSDWKMPYILIHYFGNYPVNEAIIAPHAGRRSIGGGPLIRSGRNHRPKTIIKTEQINSDSLASNMSDGDASGTGNDEPIETIIINETDCETSLSKKRKVDTNPYQTIEIQGISSSDLDLSDLSVLAVNGIEVTGPNLRHRTAPNPRKIKQSYYHTPNILLTKDDIYGCYAFHESLDPFKVVRRLDFAQGTNIIIAEQHLVEHINNLEISNVLTSKITYTYQATAKLYRFLVSTLFIKHPLFENEPCVPIGFLLHRKHTADAHGKFFRTMKRILPSLNSGGINLIVCDETGVTKAVENELSEIPTVHVLDSKGPRISSPKLDFLLLSVGKTLSFDHTKMLHLAYFLQCNFYNQILRSIHGHNSSSSSGESIELFVQCRYEALIHSSPSLAERVLPTMEELDDEIGEGALVTLLSRSPPQVLGNGSDYEACSGTEMQLFEGLAHYYIAKDRIEWMKSKSLFMVRGLGGKEYEVKLSGRTCTCPRGRACDHVLAVLISTGLLASKI